MDHPTVKITTNGPCGHVYVDGREVKGCVAYDIHHEVSALPRVTITLSAQKLEIEHRSADYKEKREHANLAHCKLWLAKAWKKLKFWVLVKWYMWRQRK